MPYGMVCGLRPCRLQVQTQIFYTLDIEERVGVQTTSFSDIYATFVLALQAMLGNVLKLLAQAVSQVRLSWRGK
jgi:hypothetical protein